MNALTSRWGTTDEAGAYNLIDQAAILRGLAVVKEGRVFSLAVPIKGGSRGPAVPTRPAAQHFMIRDGGDYCSGVMAERAGFGFSDDVIMLSTHGTTHIDALAHVWRDGRMYNGFEARQVSSRGAARCGIDKIGPIVTRALVVDFGSDDSTPATKPIHIGALRGAVERGGIDPQPGDALLVRTGWMTAFKAGRAETLNSSGLHSDCADWIIENGFALVAADNVAVEVLPSGDAGCAVPLHIRLIRDNGVYLAELLDLDELARSKRPACLLMISPLRIEGGVGSPINPVAVL
jgi:kynurenine formamidase